MRNILITGMLLFMTGLMHGQTVTATQSNQADELRAENVSVRISDDNQLLVEMDLVLPQEMKTGSNRLLALTPVVRGNNHETELPPVYVYGRKRMIISERNGWLPDETERIYQRDAHGDQLIRYVASIPSSDWMDKSQLFIEKDLCGCGNASEEVSLLPLTAISIPKPPQLPKLLYRVPKPEEVKRRTLKGQAYIDFPLDQTVIYPDYMRNTVELARIDSTLRGFKPDEIKKISLHGYASPEGTYAHNTYLAKERTNALKSYVMKKFSIPDAIVKTDYTSENWSGFIRLAESSSLPEKAKILEIAHSDTDPDRKEAQLRAMGEVFLYMTKSWFPVLRHTDYEIEYVLPDYTAEEARGLVNEDPARLSLRELFDAAMLSGKGSDEYYRLIETAAHVYPDDPDANLNAATAALERGDVATAEKYMEKADLSTPEAKNNLKYIQILKEQE